MKDKGGRQTRVYEEKGRATWDDRRLLAKKAGDYGWGGRSDEKAK